ncbi:MAG: right-handed parallel beta-helix repeat-containing protein [Anaerolineales bacterium]|nr:right-handed parallel beta-helix repeat-containing protein [Anaerolineales bacterium]
MKRTGLLVLVACIGCLSGCNLPTTVTCSADHLIDAIADANATPATTDVIALAAGCTYELDQIIDLANGNTGLPAIISPIVIDGNGAIILRAADAPEKFRLFYVNAMGSLEISDVTLAGGYAINPALPNDLVTNSGGAILNRGHLMVSNSLIQENSAREGGGIFNLGTMTLSGVTIDSNHDYFGLPGGAGLSNIGTGIIESSTFSYNGLPERKDGIFNVGTLTMTNSTVSHSGFTGIDNEGDLSINHVTIAFNRGSAIGSCGNLSISNSIIAQPPDTGGCGCQTIHSVHPNLDTTGTCGGILASLATIRLGALADNGGPTQTHALLPGSRAIDIVLRQCLPTDQRGEPRPYGAQCDAGAFEFTGAALPQMSTTATPTVMPTNTSAQQACTFTAAVNLNCRASPGVSIYPVMDTFTAGQSAVVIGQSPDGQYLYVTGPNNGMTCAVPLMDRYGTTAGDCGFLTAFTPLPTPIVPTGIPEPATVSSPVPVNCSDLARDACRSYPQQCSWVESLAVGGGGVCQSLTDPH